MDVHPPKNGMYRYWSIAICSNQPDFNAAWAKELCCVCGLRSAECQCRWCRWCRCPPVWNACPLPKLGTTKTWPLTLGHKAGCISIIANHAWLFDEDSLGVHKLVITTWLWFQKTFCGLQLWDTPPEMGGPWAKKRAHDGPCPAAAKCCKPLSSQARCNHSPKKRVHLPGCRT